jgi:hypothetical protein
MNLDFKLCCFSVVFAGAMAGLMGYAYALNGEWFSAVLLFVLGLGAEVFVTKIYIEEMTK